MPITCLYQMMSMNELSHHSELVGLGVLPTDEDAIEVREHHPEWI
jgi:hypothetical protein